MNMIIDIPPFELADVISVLNGLLVAVSVLLAGTNSFRKHRWAWILGLSVQLGLVLFGWLTAYYGFFVNLIPACAFGWNLVKSYRKPGPIKVISDEAKQQLEVDIPRYREGGIIR